MQKKSLLINLLMIIFFVLVFALSKFYPFLDLFLLIVGILSFVILAGVQHYILIKDQENIDDIVIRKI